VKIVQELNLEGVFELSLFQHHDKRGSFVKPWHLPSQCQYGIAFEIRESFWSVSGKGDIRGMHFQVPPYENKKVVCCQKGKVQDVLLDLRSDSVTFGKSANLELSERNANAVYIPAGVAHGFQGLEDVNQLLYYTSYEYVPESDYGVHWDSFKHCWPLPAENISVRDQNHPMFSEYKSPFILKNK
jgi:dTDP-4-dehydrorhamnose 3,5-epimerase